MGFFIHHQNSCILHVYMLQCIECTPIYIYTYTHRPRVYVCPSWVVITLSLVLVNWAVFLLPITCIHLKVFPKTIPPYIYTLFVIISERNSLSWHRKKDLPSKRPFVSIPSCQHSSLAIKYGVAFNEKSWCVSSGALPNACHVNLTVFYGF